MNEIVDIKLTDAIAKPDAIANPDAIAKPDAIANPDAKMNIEDSASLIFFTNPHYLNILQQKKLCNIKDNTEEIKFYRKRIVSLFKEILKGTDDTLNREIKEIHGLFVNTSIRYFQMMDKKDIVQGQHLASEHISSDHLAANGEETPEDILNSIGGPELYSVEEADDLMMRKTISLANLDNYVITKHDTSNETRIIPLKLDMDLKANEFKTKGVVHRKKLIKSKNKKEDLSKQIVGNEDKNGGEENA
jgi:hypothetical protein